MYRQNASSSLERLASEMPHRGRPNPNQSILNQQDARSKRRGKTETKAGCCYSADTLCSQSFLLACDRALSSPFNHEEPLHRPHDLCCECRNTLFWPPDIELDFTVLCGAAAFLSLACTVWRFNPTHRPSQKVKGQSTCMQHMDSVVFSSVKLP